MEGFWRWITVSWWWIVFDIDGVLFRFFCGFLCLSIVVVCVAFVGVFLWRMR